MAQYSQDDGSGGLIEKDSFEYIVYLCKIIGNMGHVIFFQREQNTEQ